MRERKQTAEGRRGSREQAAAAAADLDSQIEQQNLEALSKAAVCAILAPAGPDRSRILAMLYKDERTAKISLYTMLQVTFASAPCCRPLAPLYTILSLYTVQHV